MYIHYAFIFTDASVYAHIHACVDLTLMVDVFLNDLYFIY